MNPFYQNPNEMSSTDEVLALFESCLDARLKDESLKNIKAKRLFSGFHEGIPGLIVDQFGDTLLIKNMARLPEDLNASIENAISFYRTQHPEINAMMVKTRHAKDKDNRRGHILYGTPTTEINENGITYALDLRLNQDDSFYLDTRGLRRWLATNTSGKTVLNTFAYTGALGIAALAGGAKSVFQSDLNAKFLQLAHRSAGLNAHSGEHKIMAGDYFKHIAQFKSQSKLFDCVIIDPPLFSKTTAGEVNLLKNWVKLVNKARPLVGDGGYLIVINNALFLSGETLQTQIQEMCASGYMEIDQIVDIPHDITGYPHTIKAPPPAKTAPYNHPTKINITRIRRKDGKRAS